jgi:hypothetical protein
MFRLVGGALTVAGLMRAIVARAQQTAPAAQAGPPRTDLP